MPAGPTKKSSKHAPRDRRSSSRQSTPLSAIADTAPPTPLAATPTSAAGPSQAPPPPPRNMAKETAYIHTSTAALVSADASIDILIERSSAGGGKANDPPSARELHALHDRIRDSVNKFMGRRSEVCDRSMRQLVQKRKERLAAEREREAARAEEAARVKREEEEREMKVKKKGAAASGRKRTAEEMEGLEESVKGERRDSWPSVGAHGMARQDGVGVHEGAQPPPSPVIVPKTEPVDLMDTAVSPSDSETSPGDPPATAPLYERAFGKDPTQFDDPTIYDIREILPEMTEDDQRNILNVKAWPASDLRDLTAGDPPDMDFSNAKPANQVNFSTFQVYAEPYIRPFTEEDVAFLKERGDRVTPYLIPQRGTRGYKEVWASEDGMDGIAPPRKQESDPNEARGSMEEMNDDTAETDEVSMGPVMNRLLSVIRPAPSPVSKKDSSGGGGNEDPEGDISMVNGDIAESQDQSQAVPGAEEHNTKPLTALPSSLDAARSVGSNLPQMSLDYESLDHRALQELRHIGFLSPTGTPDFNSHTDDEVCARLRTLQHELRRISRLNNVRKARVLELTEERMAMQEYANIADDLDNQVNTAYLKRNRSLAGGRPSGNKKGASQNRGGQQRGVAGAGGRGVSDGVRALMQKRRDWIEMVGPVVGFGRAGIPGEDETIFDEASLRRLERGERQAEAGEADGD
ncbi:Transcriptional regulator [Vermiconidia calcicola]|uniref:Transcriptional regulator n=1 Tax=Vermiconidia calcicola TaxID=1690605 RepID=A0ACC3MWF5_9PEZI|nr:Transcriptional regulator [Vermiconidia calcicola]